MKSDNKNIIIKNGRCTIYVNKLYCYINIIQNCMCGPILVFLFILVPLQHQEIYLIISTITCVGAWYIAYIRIIWMKKRPSPIILTQSYIQIPNGNRFLWTEIYKIQFIRYRYGIDCYIVTNRGKYEILDWKLYISKKNFLILCERYANKSL